MSEMLLHAVNIPHLVTDVTFYFDELEQLAGGSAVKVTPFVSTVAAVEDAAAFAMEKHLEDFLVENWPQTELGKEYDILEERGERVGQQFATDTGAIDLLALRKDKRELLVLELKRGRASDAVVGQVLRYMGYVAQELAEEGQTVRGGIIALEDDRRLRRALAAVPNVSFYRYQVRFSLVKG